MSSFIDPTEWKKSERATITNFAASLSNAQADLSGNVAQFEKDAIALIASEESFANDIVSIAASIDKPSIDQTLRSLRNTSSNVDALFAQLNTMILGNNEAASDLVTSIALAGDQIDTIYNLQSALDANVSNYSYVLSSFRSFTSSSAPK